MSAHATPFHIFVFVVVVVVVVVAVVVVVVNTSNKIISKSKALMD